MPRLPKRLTEEQRQAIIDLSKQGISKASIARRIPCTLDSVRKWASRAQLQGGGKPDLKDKPRAGPASPYTQPLKTRIKRMAKDGHSARAIASKLNQGEGIKISCTSVCNILHGGRKPLRWLRVTHKRVLGEENKIARVDFCGKWMDCRSSTFDSWVFLDAKDLYCYKSDKGRLDFAWQEVDSEPPPNLGPKAGAPWVYRFYGAVGKNFKSKLYFVPPSPESNSKQKRSYVNFNSMHFIGMMTELHEEIKASTLGRRRGGYKLIMDHATQHFSNFSKDALEQLGVKVVEGYPPQSWDLNIIENVWGVLHNKMHKKNSKDGAGWRGHIEKAWESIGIKTVNALHDGFQDRLQLVHSKGGRWCPHH